MLPMQGARVRSLVSELRSQLPCDAVKKLKTKKERKYRCCLGSIFLFPSPGYFQLGKDDLERRDGKVIAYPEENPLSA